MTTQPKRLTAEDEANVIVSHRYINKKHRPSLVELIAAALRQRDEVIRHILVCSAQSPGDCETCDAARKAAGLED